MNLKSLVAIAGAGLILAGAPARAHHAFAAEFDAKKPVHLEGDISKVELINPHAWIHVDVKAPDGKVTTWMIEAGSPNVLLRRGINKATVPKGTHVVVDGYQSKDGSMRANGRDILLPDLICRACAPPPDFERGFQSLYVNWSSDGKFFYLNYEGSIYAIPLRPGQDLPPIPASGFRTRQEVAALPGARMIPEPDAVVGPNPSMYAYPRFATQRNIYRVPVP